METKKTDCHKRMIWLQYFLTFIQITDVSHQIPNISLNTDDKAIAIHEDDFKKVQPNLESSLEVMTTYYKRMKLNPNSY